MQTRYATWLQPINDILHSPGWLLFLGFTLLFSLTYAGVFRQDDEHILAARAQSLALWGDLAEPQVYGNQRVQELIPLGDKATQIEPAHAFLAAPLYQLGMALGSGGTQMMFLLNVFVSAACVAVVYASARALGNGSKASAWAAALFGAGTMVWPFSATLYRDSLAMLMAGLAWLVWIKMEHAGTGKTRLGGLLVLALLAGILAKNTNMAMVLAIGFVLGGSWIIEQIRSRRWMRLIRVAILLAGVLVAWIVLLPSSGPLARYSASYMWDLARYFVGSLNLELAGALLGPLFSPAKSVWLYSPPLILGLLGLRSAWGERRRALTLAALMTLILFLGQGLFYRENWAGVFGWGLRYTLPILPLWMSLAVAPAVEQLQQTWRKWVVPGFLVMGITVQLAGALPNWQLMYARWAQSGLDPYQPAAAWDWHFNAIPAGWRHIVQPTNMLTAWVRALVDGAGWTWIVPVVLMALMMTVVFLYTRMGEQQAGGYKRAFLIASLLGCLAPLALPLIYQDDPAWAGDRPDLLDAVDYLNANTGAGEGVVLDSYATPLWMAAMNHWHSEARWYSLAYEIPTSSVPPVDGLSQESRTLFELLSSEGGLWYITSTDAPDYDYHHESEWLGEQFSELESIQFGPDGEVTIWHYSTEDQSE